MHASTLRPARPLASRTLEAAADLRPYGENWGTVTRTVTLTRTPAGILAAVDGEAAPLADALAILKRADRVTVLAEVPATDPTAPLLTRRAERRAEVARLTAEGVSAWEAMQQAARTLPPVIGKAAARELHRELGRLGFRNHYATAAEVLERPVPSLALLSAEDAHTVRSYARGQWGMSA
ncbi:hypothetical protein F8S09_14190 [Deinococcus sp. SDU3-2]|uniref:Uncharacterized protein n=1 Tax=Deinococcus terrestris TaxID=2651870 RepID=A0A7X1NY19_9DEIO|nr:hypothetical protein [Deinococcus terrestris]MPY67818.1 hypothetical protein [Deinococcus terrestris]